MKTILNKKREFNPPQLMIVGFFLIISIGAILLSLPVASSTGESIGLLDAFFTSTSAVCVTGLVVLDTGSDFSLFGQIVIMLLIQIGGLGFMTFSVLFAILLGKKIGFKQRLLIQQLTNSISTQGLVRLSIGILLISMLLETIAAIILTLRWTPDLGFSRALYYGIFHSISSFNNAGFGLWPDSLSKYVGDPIVNIVITFLFIIGGIGFMVIIDIFNKRSWKNFSLHTKIVILTTFYLSMSGFLFIFIMELFNSHTFGSLTWGERLWAAYFQGVVVRTAGFNTIDIGGMMAASQLFMIFLMFIGASSGSTGGGIKTNTFAVLIVSVINIIKGRSEVQILRRRLSTEIVFRSVAVIMISLLVVISSTMLLVLSEQSHQRDFMEILFETVSAFGTVGLSMGLTPHLSVFGKIIIITTMFIGRLGPLTLAFALAKKKNKSTVRYAEEKILIG